MLTIRRLDSHAMPTVDRADPLEDRPHWFDLCAPDAQETLSVGVATGISMPTLAQQAQIETSKRLREDDGALVMTATVPAVENGAPVGLVTFALTENALVTLRPSPSAAFGTDPPLAPGPDRPIRPAALLLSLLEATVAEVADRVEAIIGELEVDTADIFSAERRGLPKAAHANAVVRRLGALGTHLMRVRESLVSLSRLLLFLSHHGEEVGLSSAQTGRVDVVERDVHGLLEHVDALDARVAFLLDALIGLVSVDQNDVMKLLSMVTAVFLPPTLIASIYGMNFAAMPDLSWRYGFAAALGGMGVSAVATWILFRWRRWL